MIQGTIQNTIYRNSNYKPDSNNTNCQDNPSSKQDMNNECSDELDNLSQSEMKAMILSMNKKYKEKERQAKEFQQF